MSVQSIPFRARSPFQIIEAREWLPDLHDPDNPGLVSVRNAYPDLQGYSGVKSLVEEENAVGSTPNVAYFGRDSDGGVHTFVGASSGVYSLETDGTWVAQSTIAEGASGISQWAFTQFGNQIIALTLTQDPIAVDLDDIPTLTAPYFSDLGGSPPRASLISVVRDFIVLGGIENHPHRVQWSGHNNATAWTPSGITQSGLQDLKSSNGRVQALVSGDRGLIFQERAVNRMTYVGPGLIFQFDVIERSHGTLAPDSVCWFGDQVFYYSTQGFYKIVGDEDGIPIGQDKVDMWVRDNLVNLRDIRGTVDPVNKTVYWSAHLDNPDEYDIILVYRWDIQKWGLIRVNHLFLATDLSRGANLDSTELGDYYDDSIDNPVRQLSLDSPQWQTGSAGLYAFTANKKRASFEGDYMAAALETGYRQLSPDYTEVFIRQLRPIVNKSNLVGQDAITVTTRESLIGGIARAKTALIRENGRCDIRAPYGRYGSFTMHIGAGTRWDGFAGFTIESGNSGKRRS